MIQLALLLSLTGTFDCFGSLFQFGRALVQNFVPAGENEQWEFMGKLGAGGFGEVHLVKNQRNPEELRAFKVPLSREAAEDIRREQKSHRKLQQLKIPRLVGFHGSKKLALAENSKRQWGLMLEYIRGESLNKKLAKFVMGEFDPLSFERERIDFLVKYLGYLVQAFDFLEVLHQYGLVVIDLSPANLMVQNEEVSFIDPAQVISLKSLKFQRALNPFFQIRASASYASIDDIDNKTIDFNYDFFSLGMIAFQALALTLIDERIANELSDLAEHRKGREDVIRLLDSIQFFSNAELDAATKETLHQFLEVRARRVSSAQNGRAHLQNLVQKIANLGPVSVPFRASVPQLSPRKFSAGATIRIAR